IRTPGAARPRRPLAPDRDRRPRREPTRSVNAGAQISLGLAHERYAASYVSSVDRSLGFYEGVERACSERWATRLTQRLRAARERRQRNHELGIRDFWQHDGARVLRVMADRDVEGAGYRRPIP